MEQKHLQQLLFVFALLNVEEIIAQHDVESKVEKFSSSL
jgi:hypothetical protein